MKSCKNIAVKKMKISKKKCKFYNIFKKKCKLFHNMRNFYNIFYIKKYKIFSWESFLTYKNDNLKIRFSRIIL